MGNPVDELKRGWDRAGDILTGGMKSATEWGLKGFDIISGKYAADKNVEYQKKFAKKGIQWRVQDAIKAGIHPLYALGANVTPFTPINDFANMGQNIQRAAGALLSRPEREFQEKANALTLERMSLENDLLKSQKTVIDRGTTPPGQNPNDPASLLQDPSNQANVPVPITSTGWMRNEDGSLTRVYSNASKQTTEDDIFAQGQWHWRNTLLPIMGYDKGNPPPKDLLPEGATHWSYSQLKNSWEPKGPKSYSQKSFLRNQAIKKYGYQKARQLKPELF